MVFDVPAPSHRAASRALATSATSRLPQYRVEADHAGTDQLVRQFHEHLQPLEGRRQKGDFVESHVAVGDLRRLRRRTRR